MSIERGLQRPPKKRFGKRETVLAAGLAGVGVGAWLSGNDQSAPAAAQMEDTDPGRGKSNSDSSQRPPGGLRRRHDYFRDPPISPAETEHQKHRRATMSDTLEMLTELDENLSVTTTTHVNDQPITDQFFGVSYRFDDGNYGDLAQIYPDETTGQIYVSPSHELDQWVEQVTGQPLNGYAGSTPENVANAISDLLVLEQLYQQQQAGDPVTSEDVATALLDNEYVSTEEAVQAREEAADTGY